VITLLAVAPIVVPLAATALALALGWRRSTAIGGVVASLAILASGIGLSARAGSRPVITAGHLLRADTLTAFMLMVIGGVGTLATWASVDYLDTELADGSTNPAGARQYATLVPLFLSSMSLAVLADNLGVIWTAIEATTIATAFLVGHRRTRQSLEATWKYVIVCSFGITLAFLGTVLIYLVSIHAGASAGSALDLDVLAARAGHFDPALTRLAVGLLFLGFGAKAGLVPFHTWIADAHSQAPAPVSALMSGVLLAVAFSILLRLRVIADLALGAGYLRGMFLVVGLATLLVAVSLLIGQRDLKRLLAYSSLEQMGLLAVASASRDRLASAGVLLLIAAHGAAKAVLFLTAGRLQHAYHSTLIADVRGLITRSRLLGAALAVGLVGLVGLPPFGLFAAEVAIARGMAADDLAVPLGIAGLLLAVGFVAITRHGTAMLLGETDPAAPSLIVSATSTLPLLFGVVALAALGLVGSPLAHFLTSAAAVVGP
jgi:hydrogenase-4 component F